MVKFMTTHLKQIQKTNKTNHLFLTILPLNLFLIEEKIWYCSKHPDASQLPTIQYFPKPWKEENRIYLKKPDKSSCLIPRCSDRFMFQLFIQINFTFGKVFERVILQEAVSALTENNLFEGKNVHANQKTKTLPKPYFLF